MTMPAGWPRNLDFASVLSVKDHGDQVFPILVTVDKLQPALAVLAEEICARPQSCAVTVSYCKYNLASWTRDENGCGPHFGGSISAMIFSKAVSNWSRSR